MRGSCTYSHVPAVAEDEVGAKLTYANVRKLTSLQRLPKCDWAQMSGCAALTSAKSMVSSALVMSNAPMARSLSKTQTKLKGSVASFVSCRFQKRPFIPGTCVNVAQPGKISKTAGGQFSVS